MDPSEPRWRANSSFSPPLSRRWDCRYQSDGLSQETPGDPLHGSSPSSHSKGSISVMGSDQYANHQHSVSDGALSYFESPALRSSRWTPPIQRYDLAEFSTPSGGATINSSSPHSNNDRRFTTTRVSPMSRSLFSPSPVTESGRWASSSKHPPFLPARNFSGRRSFMSTPVYPVVFRNPVSVGESSGIAGTSTSHGIMTRDHSINSPPWPENTYIPDVKFHVAFSDFHKVGASPEPYVNSRREGVRRSNRSSYDFGLDGDSSDIMDHINLDYNLRSPNGSARYQKCGLCYRVLSQKSPWSSHRIVRSSDLPVAGILPCGHVFHADCLEEATLKSLLHEPPCPLCLNLVTHEGPTSLSEPLLQAALRSTPPGTRGAGMTSNHVGSSSGRDDVDLRRNQSHPSRGSSSVRSRLRKRLLLKGKIGRELFGAKMFKKT